MREERRGTTWPTFAGWAVWESPHASLGSYTAPASRCRGACGRWCGPGLPCRELLVEGERAVAEHRFPQYGKFVAHGIGMVSHEQPNIAPTNARPLEAGMVLSIETEFIHPEVGHVKIEDAVAVTEAGCEGLGDLGRDWHVVRL